MADPLTGSIAVRVLLEDAATSGAAHITGGAPSSAPRDRYGRFLPLNFAQQTSQAYQGILGKLAPGLTAAGQQGRTNRQFFNEVLMQSKGLRPQDMVEGMVPEKANNKYLKLIAGVTGIYGMIQLVKQSKILSATVGAFLQIVGAIFDVILAPFIPLLFPMLKAFARLVPALMKLSQGDILGFVKDIAASAWKQIEEIASLAWKNIETMAQGFWNLLRSFAETVWDLIRRAAEGAWNSIRAYAESVWNMLRSFIESIWNGIRTYAETVWDLIKKAAEGFWSGIKSFAENAWNLITTAAETVWKTIETTATTIWNNIVGIAEKAWKDIVDFFKDILNSLIHPTSLIKKVINPFGILPFGGKEDKKEVSSNNRNIYNTDNRKVDIHINAAGLTTEQIIDAMNKALEEQANERKP